jgi:hypothetical protein
LGTSLSKTKQRKDSKSTNLNIVLFDFNNILTDVAEELRRRGHTLLGGHVTDEMISKADVIVLWNETPMGGWDKWVKKLKGKRTVLMQHGRRGTSRIYPPFNEPLKSDVICAWSENDVRRLTNAGVPREKIRVTGTTVFSHLKPRVPHDGINVVFSPEHWDIDVAENFIVNSQLAKLKGVNVITKCLIDEHTQGIYPNPVWSDRRTPEHIDIVADVLSKADVVVAVSESTFELCAQYLDIPVIIADIWTPKSCGGDERYREYTREYSDACVRVKDVSKLNDAIYYAIKHPEHLREERKQIVVNDGGVDILSPLEEICKVIEEK